MYLYGWKNAQVDLLLLIALFFPLYRAFSMTHAKVEANFIPSVTFL